MECSEVKVSCVEGGLIGAYCSAGNYPAGAVYLYNLVREFVIITHHAVLFSTPLSSNKPLEAIPYKHGNF